MRRTGLVVAPIAVIQLVVFVGVLHDPIVDWATYWLYTVVGVIVPGQLLLRSLTRWDTDWLTTLGLGWALGHAAELVGLLAGRQLGQPVLFVAWIPLAYALGGRRLARQGVQDVELQTARRTAIAVAVLFCVAAVPYVLLNLHALGAHTDRISDAWFHVGNAAEFRTAGPLTNPRVAGTALVYHMFSYAPAAAASLVTPVPVATLLLQYSGLSSVCLLVLLIFNVARTIARGGWLVGAVSVLAFLVPFDLLGLLSSRLSAGSSVVMYGLDLSPTTLGGYVFVAALLLPVAWSAGRFGWGDACVAGGLAFAASGSKSMVGPLLVCGAAALVGWRVVVRRHGDWSALRLAAVLTLAAAAGAGPVLLAGGGYQDTAHLALGGAVANMPLDVVLVNHPLLHRILLVAFPLAIAPVVIATACLALLGRTLRTEAERHVLFVWAVFAAALVPTITFFMPGTSQLFFLYFGLLGLATISGHGLALAGRAARRRPGRACAALAALVLLVVTVHERVGGWVAPVVGDNSVYSTGLRLIVSEGVADAAAPVPQLTLTDGVKRGLEWVRTHLPGTSIVVTDVADALPYTALTQTRGWMVTTTYTPESFADQPGQAVEQAYGARLAVLQDWRNGNAAALAAMRAAGVSHVLIDRVNDGSLRLPVPGTALFDDGDIAVYSLGDLAGIH